MKLEKLIEAVDAQILKGDIVGAFDSYAADNCVTKSNPQDVTSSKAQKLETLRWFFDNIASINRIERPVVLVNGEVTDSQFVFDFTNKQGETLVYNEVIRRTWKDGKIVEEQYLIDQAIEAPKKTAAQKPAKKEAVKDAQPAAAKPAAAKAAAPKAAAVKAEKPAAAKTVKPAKAAAPKAAAAKVEAPKAAKKPAAKTSKTKK